MKPNVALLQDIATWITNQTAEHPQLEDRLNYAEEHPDPTALYWNQNNWHYRIGSEKDTHCGTACCVAGYAALTDPEVKTIQFGYVYPQVQHVREYAMDRLGLTWEEAHNLFAANNTAEEVLANIDLIIERATA